MSAPTVIFWGSYDALRTLSAADVDAACEPSDGGIPDPTNGVVSANLCVLLNGTVNATLLAGLQCAPLGPCYQLNHASRALFYVFCFFAPFAGCCCCCCAAFPFLGRQSRECLNSVVTLALKAFNDDGDDDDEADSTTYYYLSGMLMWVAAPLFAAWLALMLPAWAWIDAAEPVPSQEKGWRYAEGAFDDEPPFALIGIEAAIVLGIPLAWGVAWKPYKWAKDNLRSWVAAGGRTASPPAFDAAGSREVAVEKL